jgi:hypothetical protein
MARRNTRAPRPRWIAIAIAAAFAVWLFALPGAAAARDRNHDKLPDRWEKRFHLSLQKKQGRRDQDRDQLKNRFEFKAGMNPRDADTDGDGVEDGDEGAGVIDSFDADTGVLTINVFAGGSISGLVTDDTEIECENDDADEPDQPGDDDEGDDEGDEVGDDGPGEEEGDDDVGEEVERGVLSEDDEVGNDDEGDDEDEDEEGDDDACGVDDLVPGRVVREAELELGPDGLFFEEIELK